jgi:SAM-dependent methyltransferase
MKVYTTEITSDNLVSDNPIHQRLLMPYYYVRDLVKGDLIEPGCGEGRGIEVLRPALTSYLGIDKIGPVIAGLQSKYTDCRFREMHFPPFDGIGDNSFDCCVSFQVIEHIKDDSLFVSEIYRVLRPGGMAVITTPNRKMSLTRNPWHIREYLPDELSGLASKVFPNVEMRGITGNDKVMGYYEENKRSVRKITRFDFLNLQYRLPSAMLRIPYDLMNRINRNLLKKGNKGLVSDITYKDYIITDDTLNALDLICIVHK